MRVDPNQTLVERNFGPGDFGEPRDTNELAAALAHQLADAVMTVAGSLFWAMLAVGWLGEALGPVLR